jgi:hypothetical protein
MDNAPARRAKRRRLFAEVPADRREEKVAWMPPIGDGGGPEARNRTLRAVGGTSLAYPFTGHISKGRAKRGLRNNGL